MSGQIAGAPPLTTARALDLPSRRARARAWWRAAGTEAKLLLVGIPVLIWTLLPIYHLALFAISPKEDAFSGRLFPAHPTLQNFAIVFGEKHYFLSHFWRQFGNSVLIAGATGILTLLIATGAAFAISRLKVRGGRTVMNLALLTYFIPAAFLAVPMYKTMGNYGLLNSQWALILAMVTIASPYAIWVLKQASDKLPVELDEAAIMDGASPPQLFRLVYLPLMAPTLVAIGIYALLLAWNEYLFAFLLLSNDTDVTLPVALGNFLAADDSPWELLMTTGLIYALPPARDLLRLQALHGGRPHGRRREELTWLTRPWYPGQQHGHGGTLIVNGGYDARTGTAAIQSGAADLVAFGVAGQLACLQGAGRHHLGFAVVGEHLAFGGDRGRG